ncbi:hypothetical protein Psch_00340 [Pelotomaculum schinkii]|uniref:Tox-SHH domain-containing protein n=1 Tax=Pelotomaculum schinkii TaxID=78350 RepID=A0A4Y7RCR1_9FIRM|nr:hypothetical protein Psch_00340 [Pelotomaculum schinkii]
MWTGNLQWNNWNSWQSHGREYGGAFVTGAIGGAAAGFTGGLSLAAGVGINAGAWGLGSIAGQYVATGSFSWGQAAWSGIGGGIGYGIGRYVGNLFMGTGITGVSEVKQGLRINNLPLAKPGEDLYVGTYSKSIYWNKKTGLNLTHTPHHIVQDAVSGTSHGRGMTINIRQDIHKLTETFGSSRNLPNPRQHLAADIKEMRNLLKEFGYDRSIINAQLWELLKQNKSLGEVY